MAEHVTIDRAFVAEPWDRIAATELDGEVVLYDEQTGRVHVLNHSGAVVWQLLDGTASVGEIAAAIAEASGGDLDAVTFDVLALVRMLADLGVLVGFDPAEVEPPAP